MSIVKRQTLSFIIMISFYFVCFPANRQLFYILNIIFNINPY